MVGLKRIVAFNMRLLRFVSEVLALQSISLVKVGNCMVIVVQYKHFLGKCDWI